jgi:hypothetical protein
MGICQSQPHAKVISYCLTCSYFDTRIFSADFIRQWEYRFHIVTIVTGLLIILLPGGTFNSRSYCIPLTNYSAGAVPLKPKAIDHFLDSCEQPTHRRHTFWNGKDQFSQDPIHPNLLQAQTLFFVHGCSKSSVPKKHTLCCTYVIEDLSVGYPVHSSYTLLKICCIS